MVAVRPAVRTTLCRPREGLPLTIALSRVCGNSTMRILVAEDERFLADLVADGLREHTMAVDVAYDGAAALERLAVNEPEVCAHSKQYSRQAPTQD